uniref:Outer envelope pore protein 24B, chloroplastic-like n=1 Tax=Elaeis guineensis var. tenera TaxID=51953 RepID=A0A8N4ER22_ELAGV|nr:outer envelope pore protein 24B, chloroplastic-like [Elaeis guineensis]
MGSLKKSIADRGGRSSVKGRYEVDKSSISATFAVNVGDLKLKAFMTDATFVHGPSLNGLALSLEKLVSFIIDHNVPKKDVRFQLMNSVRILDKTVSLTYTYARGDNRVGIDSSVAFDLTNKVSMSYALDLANCKVKYVYTHEVLRRTVLEPYYDVSKNSWDFAVTRKFEGGDLVKATYQTSSKNLGLEWNKESRANANQTSDWQGGKCAVSNRA